MELLIRLSKERERKKTPKIVKIKHKLMYKFTYYPNIGYVFTAAGLSNSGWLHNIIELIVNWHLIKSQLLLVQPATISVAYSRGEPYLSSSKLTGYIPN